MNENQSIRFSKPISGMLLLTKGKIFGDPIYKYITCPADFIQKQICIGQLHGPFLKLSCPHNCSMKTTFIEQKSLKNAKYDQTSGPFLLAWSK